MLLYVHILVSRDALRFFYDAVFPIAMNFAQKVDLIVKEGKFSVCKARVKNQLHFLRVSLLFKDKMEIYTLLAAALQCIKNQSRQVPPLHRGKTHRVEYLRYAVVSDVWSHESLVRVATQGLSFSSFTEK